jgi:hypothetical protein
MGEYAIRKSDNQEIKIGTCESMYYLRYSDRHMVRALEGNVDPMDEGTVKELRFRLPFPDEDKVKPGEYKDYSRGASLSYDFKDEGTVNTPGIVQLHSKCGMMVNVTCYHGEKLPEDTKDARFFFNGKAPFYEVKHLKFFDGVVYGVYTCTECGQSWRQPLKDLIPFMIRYEDQDLVKRLIEWYVPDLLKKGSEKVSVQ